MNGVRTAALVLALGQPVWAQEPATEPLYARITAKETQPRCFASDRSPQYGDRLVEGQVVRVGEQVGEFRRVELPLGPTGYVHKRFASPASRGMIAATAEKVSFRYRPQTSEVPVQVMGEGTELFLLGEDAEWWKVANPNAEAFLPASELELVAGDTADAAAAWDELDAARRQAWSGVAEEREAAKEAAEARARQVAALDGLAGRLREMSAPGTPIDAYDALHGEVAAIAAALPEESAERARALGLGRAIQQQKLVAEALMVVAEEPPTRDVTAEVLPAVEQEEDPLSRFDGVGWLHREERDDGSTRYTLEKGGKLLYVVTCSSGRYELGLFDGIELGIRGGKSRPHDDSVRELDALKIEVLKTGR